MSVYISKKNRLKVKLRADNCCEYCRIPELFSFIGYEIDHIIARKHGGSNELINLAWACSICNNLKGTDLGTILLPSQELIRFYNPRSDVWEEHFELQDSLIISKTEIGEATIKIFQLNSLNRIDEREALINADLFPPPDSFLGNY